MIDPFGIENTFAFKKNFLNTSSDTYSTNRRRSSSNTGEGMNSFYTSYSQDVIGGVGAIKKKGGSKYDITESVVPCTIKMIQEAMLLKKLEENNVDNLILHGKSVGAVVLRGWVLEVEKFASQLKFKLCDGTGVLEVHFNIAATEETESEKGGWRYEKTKHIKKGKLICLIGTPVASKKLKNEKEQNITNQEAEKNNTASVCTLEACHFRLIEDFNEYAYYSDFEIIYAATQMKEKENEEIITDNTYVRETTQEEEGYGKKVLDEGSGDEFKDIKVPESLSHITNETQKKIIRIILEQPENKAGRISSQDIIKIIHKKYPRLSEEDIKNEIDTLLDDGDIMYTHEDFVDIV